MKKQAQLDALIAGASMKGLPLTAEETTIAVGILSRLSYRLRHAEPQLTNDGSYTASYFMCRDIGTIKEALVHAQLVAEVGS